MNKTKCLINLIDACKLKLIRICISKIFKTKIEIEVVFLI